MQERCSVPIISFPPARRPTRRSSAPNAEVNSSVSWPVKEMTLDIAAAHQDRARLGLPGDPLESSVEGAFDEAAPPDTSGRCYSLSSTAPLASSA